MEAATLDVADVAWQEEEAESEESRSAWGRLFPVCEGFHALGTLLIAWVVLT